MRYNDVSYAHRHVEGALRRSRDPDVRLHGVVGTPHGYVRVVALDDAMQADEKWGPVTRLLFIWRGRYYDRTYPRVLTPLGAARAAARFAREIAQETE